MTKLPFLPLKLAHWPAEDAQLWKKARARGRLLSRRGAYSWRPATALNAERGYGVYLEWQSAQGLLDPHQPMEERVTPKLIEQFATEYGDGRAPLTLAGTIRDIAMMLRACVPPDGLPWLTQLGFRLVNNAKPEQSKLLHIESPAVLLGLGERLMEEGKDLLSFGHEDGARHYRDGLMIAVLAARPALRRNALGSLRLGQTLSKIGHAWRFSIPPSSSKTKRRLAQSFPDHLTQAIDFYVHDVRTLLLKYAPGEDDGWMWLGREGALTANRITTIVSSTTHEYLGKSVSPHRFRDSAATGIAIHAPHLIGITKGVLGHASLRSSQEYYDQALSFTASTELADLIEDVRKSK